MEKDSAISGRGGARTGSGRKRSLSTFEAWEAAALCDRHETKQRKEWALQRAFGPEKLQRLKQHWAEISSGGIKDGGDGEFPLWLRQSESPMANGLINQKREEIHSEMGFETEPDKAARFESDPHFPGSFKNSRIGWRGRYGILIDAKALVGRCPNGILGREQIITVVARYLRRKWGREVSPSSVREAWKATRALWQRLPDYQPNRGNV